MSFFILAALVLVSAAAGASIPVEALARRYRFSVSGDIYSSRYSLRKGSGTAVIGPGLTVAVINGTVHRLETAPSFSGGELHVPEEFEALLKRHFIPVRREYWQTVTLDPGHGGRDPGAISPYGGMQEKDLVLTVALRVRDLLRDQGVNVKMTRDSNTLIPLESRANTANTWRSHLFVSIHANASEVRSPSGVEVFYGDDWTDEGIDCETRAYYLAGNMDLNHFITGSGKMKFTREQEAFFFKLMLQEANSEGRIYAGVAVDSLAEGLDTENRGIKTKNLRIIRRSACPAVLLEIGFLTNPHEARRFREPAYIEKTARLIAASILEFLREAVGKE
jgi:N-acetylmuramoyl-L-alanine amidase